MNFKWLIARRNLFQCKNVPQGKWLTDQAIMHWMVELLENELSDDQAIELLGLRN